MTKADERGLVLRDAAALNAKRAVVRVGNGRGFIVSAGEYDRYVITAAHCVPFDQLPLAHLANDATNLTFENIIGQLDAERQTICGELCVFNLCDDLAVFSAPDNQELSGECELFEQFTAAAMIIGYPPAMVESYKWADVAGAAAWVLSLVGEWQECKLHNGGRFLTLDKNATIDGGMSGSPIINEHGAAVGVISTGSSGFGDNVNSVLTDCLPPWLLRKLDRNDKS
jgi:hypothetical protein